MLLGVIVQTILATLLLPHAESLSVLEVVCKRDPTLRFCPRILNDNRNVVDDVADSTPSQAIEFDTTVFYDTIFVF